MNYQCQKKKTEEPKKYTRSKRENTGEILDAFHIVVKTNESERELEIVRNETRTLELEILEKKLELQRIMNSTTKLSLLLHYLVMSKKGML